MKNFLICLKCFVGVPQFLFLFLFFLQFEQYKMLVFLDVIVL